MSAVDLMIELATNQLTADIESFIIKSESIVGTSSLWPGCEA